MRRTYVAVSLWQVYVCVRRSWQMAFYFKMTILLFILFEKITFSFCYFFYCIVRFYGVVKTMISFKVVLTLPPCIVNVTFTSFELFSIEIRSLTALKLIFSFTAKLVPISWYGRDSCLVYPLPSHMTFYRTVTSAWYAFSWWEKSLISHTSIWRPQILCPLAKNLNFTCMCTQNSDHHKHTDLPFFCLT